MKFKYMRQLGLYERKTVQSALSRRNRLGNELKELREKQRHLTEACRREQERRKFCEKNSVGLGPQREPVLRLAGTEACYWCGVEYNPSVHLLRRSRDHLVPRALGGSNHADNIVYAHSGCNSKRNHDMTWVPFGLHGRMGEIVREDSGRIGANEYFKYDHCRLPTYRYRDDAPPRVRP